VKQLHTAPLVVVALPITTPCVTHASQPVQQPPVVVDHNPVQQFRHFLEDEVKENWVVIENSHKAKGMDYHVGGLTY